MPSNTTKQYLQKKLSIVVAYINRHLDDELTLEVLSDVACLSKFHFHRVFLQYIGVNLHRYLQLQRLKRASYQLVFETDKSVLSIALDANFTTAESFSRAFKKSFSQTPTAFRKTPLWQPWLENYQYKIIQEKKSMKINMIDFPETKIAVYEHRGAPDKLNYSIVKFIEWRKASKLSPIVSSATFGLAYDDPNTVSASDFKFDICGEVQQRIIENDSGVINKVIPAGRCAQICHYGSHDNMTDSIEYLYRQWLPESGEILRDFPLFFEYLNFFPQVAECDLQTKIYLPIV